MESPERTVREWIQAQRPGVPAELAEWLETALGGAHAPSPSPEDLTEAGVRALSSARAVPGKVRQSAFDLLTADALLTHAAQAAAGAPDPESALTRILEALAAPSPAEQRGEG
jgi:hypothetical protein